MNAPVVLTTVTKTHNVPTPMGLLLVTAMQDSQETAGSAQVSYPEIQLSSFLLFFVLKSLLLLLLLLQSLLLLSILLHSKHFEGGDYYYYFFQNNGIQKYRCVTLAKCLSSNWPDLT